MHEFIFNNLIHNHPRNQQNQREIKNEKASLTEALINDGQEK